MSEMKEQKDDRIVLCGANAYEKKYYFNHEFDKMPENIKKELNIICVMFTEEVGGIVTLVFEPDGELEIETKAGENDPYYDDIGSGLLVKEILKTRQELLQALSIYYRVFILKEDINKILEVSE